METKWIAWREDREHPSGRLMIGLVWHAEDDQGIVCLTGVPTDTQMYKFQGKKPNGPICDTCLLIVEKRIAAKPADLLQYQQASGQREQSPREH